MQTIKRAIITLTTLSLLLPGLSLAQESNITTSRGFCARVTSVRSEIVSKLADLEKRRTNKRTEITNKLKERKDERADKVKEKRDETQDKFADKLAELNASATTDVQKTAIAEFKAAVNAAQTARKTAVDAAMQTFRTERDKLVTQRQEAIRTAAATFKASVQAAIDKAKADCAAGADPVTVRTTLMASLKAANEKFHIDIKAVDKIGQQTKDLAKTRNDAIRAANKTFKDVVQVVKAKLKEALGSSSESEAETED